MSSETINNTLFQSTTYGSLQFTEMIDCVADYIKKDPKKKYRIIVGTDSDGSDFCSLHTAITVLREKNGGIYFRTASKKMRFHSMRERLWQEAMSSITMRQELKSILRERLGDDFFWDGNEIHVDAGEEGKSKEIVDSVTGMIRGYGFIPVIKPYAFGASVVADRHT